MNIRIFLFSLLSLFSTIVNASSNDIIERLALVDTGYDACVQSGGTQCAQNKNLLFRGDQPLPDDPPYDFPFDFMQTTALKNIQSNQNYYQINAPLPANLSELKNYRIVVINLLYDFYSDGSQDELTDLQNEFKDSGAVKNLQVPDQHRMYGLDSPFRTDHYAFEWWPVELSIFDMQDPQFMTRSLNWPAPNGTPIHTFKPDVYSPMNLPMLITGINKFNEPEPNAKSLHDLLMTIPDDGHPLLIYYHCVAGKDRTGAVTMGYFMTYGGYPLLQNTFKNKAKPARSQPLSYADAQKATTFIGHPANEYSMKLASAYCIMIGRDPLDCIA
jgi:hypothetical protein